MSEHLVVNEIYLSIQGESTLAGLPCVFIRLTGCNLRCSYCDTAYAFTEGKRRNLKDILGEVEEKAESRMQNAEGGGEKGEGRRQKAELRRESGEGSGEKGMRLPLVELTGGEPLLQRGSIPLMRALCDRGYVVLVETSGALDIGPVDPRVRRIMDLKCPSSGEVERNRWENLLHLRPTDEVKFVIGTREDYDWAAEAVQRHRLHTRCAVLFSWVSPLLPAQRDASLKAVPAGQTAMSRRALVEAILADGLPVRFQLQMHKFIWPPEERGV